jgi:putative tricarboxylic transport membrane protein
VIAFAIVGAYIALLPLIGFRLASALFVAVLQATIDRPRTGRGAAAVLAVAIGTAAITYFVFERYLLVLLPRGTWTGF